MNRIEASIIQALGSQGITSVDRQHLDGLIIDSLVNIIDRLGSEFVLLQEKFDKLSAEVGRSVSPPDQPACGISTEPVEYPHPSIPEAELVDQELADRLADEAAFDERGII